MESLSGRKRVFYDVEEEEDEQMTICAQKLNGGKVAAAIIMLVHCALLYSGEIPQWFIEMRAANERRERARAVEKILNMSRNNPRKFQRYYRLHREDFFDVHDKIKEDIESDKKYADLSSGSPIPTILKLAITLRFLAGGSYLDIAFGYEVHESSVYVVVWDVLEAINKHVDNIKFPYGDEIKLRDLEQSFMKFHNGNFPGTVAAGDGIVFRIWKPPGFAVDENITSFFNRKGFYGYGMQGFCDGNCKFVHISMKTCSSTHDSTAYIVSGMSKIIEQGLLPPWAHIVLDDAYNCSQQELTPWKGRDLTPEKDTFNYFLSLNRQCIERAFGILVQRWGVFWRAMRVAFHRIPLIITVCCKLHNMCIDRYTTSANVETAHEDRFWERGRTPSSDVVNRDALFTDGTNGRGGNFFHGTRRGELTQHLANLRARRPRHSQIARQNRI